MVNVNCLNNISQVGLKLFTDDYNLESSFEDAQAVLVRSAKMHDLELSDNLIAIARAGAGVNNIPLDKCAEAGVKLTNAGATFPYGKDPKDSNIRIAPSFPTPEDMALAADIFVLCVKLVSIDKILESK